MSEANHTSPTQGHGSDDAQTTNRLPFTARATNARIQAGDALVEFGTPGRVDDARLTVEATTGDEVVAEPMVSLTATAPVDDSGGVAVAGCLRPDQARELAALAETCCSDDEIRSEPETVVEAVAAVARLDTDRADVTILDDTEAWAGVLYSDSDDDPTIVIDTGSPEPEIGAGAQLSFDELRAVAAALRAEAEVVEQGGGR